MAEKRTYLSGAQKRKAARERAERAAAAESAAVPTAPASTQTPPPAPTAAARSSRAADFAQLEPAPLGAPAQAIAWVNDCLLLALDQVLRDPDLKNTERWRWIKEFSAVLGMVRDKASEQAAIKRALRTHEATEKAQGTVHADGRSKKTVPRPSG
jgi:hypothetical protein